MSYCWNNRVQCKQCLNLWLIQLYGKKRTPQIAEYLPDMKLLNSCAYPSQLPVWLWECQEYVFSKNDVWCLELHNDWGYVSFEIRLAKSKDSIEAAATQRQRNRIVPGSRVASNTLTAKWKLDIAVGTVAISSCKLSFFLSVIFQTATRCFLNDKWDCNI